MASAASQASGTRLPRAFAPSHSRVKMPQWRSPGATGTALGKLRTAPAKASAAPSGLGRANARGCVTMRMKPLSTWSLTPKASAARARPASQPAYSAWRSASARCA